MLSTRGRRRRSQTPKVHEFKSSGLKMGWQRVSTCFGISTILFSRTQKIARMFFPEYFLSLHRGDIQNANGQDRKCRCLTKLRSDSRRRRKLPSRASGPTSMLLLLPKSTMLYDDRGECVIVLAPISRQCEIPSSNGDFSEIPSPVLYRVRSRARSDRRAECSHCSIRKTEPQKVTVASQPRDCTSY